MHAKRLLHSLEGQCQGALLPAQSETALILRESRVLANVPASKAGRSVRVARPRGQLWGNVACRAARWLETPAAQDDVTLLLLQIELTLWPTLVERTMSEATNENEPTTPAPSAASFSSVEKAPLTAEQLESAKHDYRFLRLFAITTLVLATAASFTLNLVDPDLWGHVRYGQELLEDKALPTTATHTFTAEGYRWINHENIAEIVFAVGFEKLGVTGMLVAKCLLGMSIILMMVAVARRQQVRLLTAWVFFMLVATNLKAFFPMRPQLLSFFCCAIMLLFLEKAFFNWRNSDSKEPIAADGSRRFCQVNWAWLIAILPLMILWVNAHGGFVAGICILGAMLGGRIIEAVVVDRHRSKSVVFGLAAVGIAALATTVANPYGIGLVQWLAESLGTPRPEITEWHSPKPHHVVFWPFVILAVVNVASWAFTDRRRDWTKLAILLLVGWQASEHLRHIAFFALLSGFWTLPHLQAALSRARSKAAEGLPVTQIGPVMKWGGVGAMSVAMILQANFIATSLTTLPVSRNMYPIDAFDYMATHDLSGRMVVSFNWAQFALAAFPDSTVSFDGRFRTCYPQEVVDMNFDFLLGDHEGWRSRSPSSGPIDGSRVLRYGDPELVIVDRNYKHAVKVMKAELEKDEPEWAVLYQDAVAQIWGRADIFDDPNSDRYLAETKRSISNIARPKAVQWPAWPVRFVPHEVASSESTAPAGDI